MISITLPKSPKYEATDKKSGKFIIEGCYPGFGTTIGNSLRRALLSSLPGNAVVSAKIKGITHEFTTLKNVKEDVVQLVLNLKKIRFKMHDVEEATVFLKVRGEKEVTAKDFKTTSEIEVVNLNQHLATLTASTASIEMEIKVQRGLGYLPVEQQEREEREIGTIAIDAVYNPVKRVNFLVENMRVGKRTDYDKITLDVVTDGSVTPEQAYEQAVEILMSQFNAVATVSEEEEEAPKEMEVDIDKKKKEDKKKTPKKVEEEDRAVKELNLSTRTQNVLKANDIEKVSQLGNMIEEDLSELEGMGDKGVKEIKKAIGTLGITLRKEEQGE